MTIQCSSQYLSHGSIYQSDLYLSCIKLPSFLMLSFNSGNICVLCAIIGGMWLDWKWKRKPKSASCDTGAGTTRCYTDSVPWVTAMMGGWFLCWELIGKLVPRIGIPLSKFRDVGLRWIVTNSWELYHIPPFEPALQRVDDWPNFPFERWDMWVSSLMFPGG